MTRARVRAAVVVYGTLGGAAWAFMAWLHRSPWHLERTVGGTRWLSLPLSAVLGVATGVLGVKVSQTLARQCHWGRSLHQELRLGLAGLSPRAALPLALASAIGEELCFRGALQQVLMDRWGTIQGLAAASALFGLMHVPWNRRLLTWTATAVIMGVVFGTLYLVTGELLAPVAAHAVINHENLLFILSHEPASPTPPPVPRRVK